MSSSISLADKLVSLESGVASLQKRTTALAKTASSHDSRIRLLESTEAERSTLLFQLLHQTSKANPFLSSIGSANIPLVVAFTFVSGQEIGKIACVSKQWRALSSEIKVQEEIWVKYAQKHYPTEHQSYIEKSHGKAAIVYFVKQNIKLKGIKSEFSAVGDSLIGIQKRIDNLEKIIAVEAIVVGVVGLCSLPPLNLGPHPEYDMSLFV